MKLLSTTSMIAFGLLTTAAFARDQETAGWYAGINGDISFPRNTGVSGNSTGSIHYNFSSGGDLLLGYKPNFLSSSFGNVRIEADAGYHAFGLKHVLSGNVNNTNPKGDLTIASLMGTAYYDIRTHTQFTPYIGVGVGDAQVSFDKSNGFGMTKGSDNTLAYQFMTGVAYTPESMPETDWFVGYKYLGTTAPKFTTAAGSVKFDALSANNIEIGVRYHF